MPHPDTLLYSHLKEQKKLIECQIAKLQELLKATEADILKVEEQVKERSQMQLF